MKKKTFFILLNCFIILDIYQNPLLFRNANIFKFIETNIEELQSIEFDYVKDLIKGIPYVETENNFLIDPRKNYISTIKNGKGNCSNLVYGAAFKLLNDKKDFKIIHFFGINWERGGGHTVLLLNIEDQLVFLDVLEGGIWKPIGKFDLKQNNEVEFINLNYLKKLRYHYFPRVLDNPLGCIDDYDVEKYFNFLDNIYFKIGNPILEVYIYQLICLLFKKYPEIEVQDSLIIPTFKVIKYKFYLFWLRTISLVSILFMTKYLFKNYHVRNSR